MLTVRAGPPIIPLQKDYSSSSLKYRDRENIYGTLPSHSQRDSLYGTTNLYGGASSSNLYQPRRSSQYEIQPPGIPPMGEPPIYEQGPRPQKYLATSKSSSNLYHQPHYGAGYMDPNRSLTRQQKTLSMHGAPNTGNETEMNRKWTAGSGRNNNVMETAASIIANAHQQSGMGLGTNTDWWNTSYGMPGSGPTGPAVPNPGLQHEPWAATNQKNTMWNPPAAFGGVSSASTASVPSMPKMPVVFVFCYFVLNTCVALNFKTLA